MDKKKQDKLNLLYVSDLDSNDTITVLERESIENQSEFIVQKCYEISKSFQIIESVKPEIVVVEFDGDLQYEIEKFVKEVKSLSDKYCPAIFLILSSDPGIKLREKMLIKGYNEFFIKPFSIIELVMKSRAHAESQYLYKMDAWRKNKLETALKDIEKFEKDLASVKNELFDERDVLNNSLKQINLMTKERDKLKKEIKHADKELIENLEGFTKLLCNMIESRVEENRGHSFRVAEISCFVAEEMKFTKTEKEQLEKAAMLHEVGKLLISKSILNKKEHELEDNEKGFLKHYPEKGAKLLEMCSGFDKIANIVLYQNENVDGSGNPEGLKRKHIPLQSRILAGANLFDELRC
ncbi:MAG: HD domain-containing protein, partial [Desulfobacteraceae bacterium]|nr:HD domain-containing protein [Desulfobacteraceae bacterium]